MSFETQESNEVKEQQEKFEKEFKDDAKSPEFDSETFKDLVAWIEYDENMSKEDNLRKAFDENVWNMIDKNLKNLTPENKDNLNRLKKEALSGMSDINEIISAFQEVKDLISSRNWISAKPQKEAEQRNSEAQNKQKSEKLQEFIDELLKSIKENNEKEAENREKARKEANERRNQEEIERNENPPSLEWFPTPEQESKTI